VICVPRRDHEVACRRYRRTAAEFAEPETLTSRARRTVPPGHRRDQRPKVARAASMSRSTFAAHFRAASGEPPLTYLHRWRIHLAQAALRDTDSTVAALAAEFGYASESSFSHAFTRTVGISPRRYRSLHRGGTPAALEVAV
jgi:AraC-like DNA-binding protein